MLEAVSRAKELLKSHPHLCKHKLPLTNISSKTQLRNIRSNDEPWDYVRPGESKLFIEDHWFGSNDLGQEKSINILRSLQLLHGAYGSIHFEPKSRQYET